VAHEAKPSVRRRVLGSNLRRVREEKGLLLEHAAKELGCHPGKISRIESARSGIRQLDLRVLLDLYGINDERSREGWLTLARENRSQRWWRALEGKLPDDFLELVGLEDEVSACRAFDPGTVHGLLQTEAYASSIIRGGSTSPLSDAKKAKLCVRMERQKALHRTDGTALKLWVVLGEAALRQQVGGPQVLREQLHHLVEVAQLPNVTLQVLPFTAGAIKGGLMPFVIFSFPEPADLGVVLLEHYTSHAFLEHPNDTSYYGTAFDHHRAAALSPLDSESLILRIADELPRK
jgi:transcriptional regulator with XRE-family HTH domain